METLRLFAAIHIVPSENLTLMYNSFRQTLDFNIIKWVELNNLHITLRFFGDTRPEEVPIIQRALQKATQGIAPFEIKLQNIGVFGSHYDPRVIWFGIEENLSILTLHDNIVKSLEEVEYFGDRQNFVPHLTIARIKEIKDKRFFQQILDRFSNAELLTQSVNEFSLYESTLKKTGPIHKCIETFSF